MRVGFTTLGCKVNQYETQKIAESFAREGFTVVPFESVADWYVVNSCSVTDDADAKSHYVVRRARRANPLAKVVVTGCASQASANRGEAFDGADLVVPNPEKASTVAHVLRVLGSQRPRPLALSDAVLGARARATLKIQDGCDVLCSYCSIPWTRPGMVSRPAIEVLAEARALARMGFQEVVLTGVLIGAYGPESGSGGPGFEDLVEAVANESGLARVRVSSIEFHHVTDRLLALIRAGLVAPHLHVPLQSGDDAVLADMGRRYLRADYMGMVGRLRAELPNVALTTDIMVGFPTEDEARFDNTLALAEEAGFAKAHVFRFSPRSGTVAHGWGDPVPHEVKKQRAERLAALCERSASSWADQQIGRLIRVVFEGRPGRDGTLSGMADDGTTVRCAAHQDLVRTLQHVRVTGRDATRLIGEVVPAPTLSIAPG